MPEQHHRLRRTDQGAGATAYRLVLLAHRMAAAHRTDFRKFVRFCTFRPLVQDDTDHLRDHVAGALDHHGVADTKIGAIAYRIAVVADALDVILVVQRRIRDDDAADGDRLEPRHRRQRTGAADLDIDAVEDRRRLL